MTQHTVEDNMQYIFKWIMPTIHVPKVMIFDKLTKPIEPYIWTELEEMYIIATDF